jgi:SAM-dependent MidA family methyltransferase
MVKLGMVNQIPSPEAINHSQQLLAHICSEIKNHDGKISFAQYMNLALYTPGLGYYSGRLQKFGARGDFVTAPEISPLFSQCLANQCQQILETLGHGNILEIGAGSGQMASDILIELKKLNRLPEHYYILELSADLKKRQQEKLTVLCPEFFDRIIWLETLPNRNFNGVILANEVLDAMPAHQFRIHNDILQEASVIENNNKLEYQFSKTNNLHLLELYHSQAWPKKYISEINLNLKPWILSLSDILKSGIILIIDYGFPKQEYYHPDRTMGTLMCHYRHYAHQDPFFYPGLQDITAHVDFTAIADGAIQAELDVLGYTSQAAFLLSTGLTNLAEKKYLKTEKEKVIQNQAIQTLTSPAEMGELFKVISLGRNFEAPLLGFKLNDRRYAL